MSTKLNKNAYVQLIEEDIKWLEANTHDCLEQDHTLQVLRHSIRCYYPDPKLKKQSWVAKVTAAMFRDDWPWLK